MTPDEIVEKLAAVGVNTADLVGPCFAAFCEHMTGRQYGYDALRDAWAWYFEGWNDAH